MKSKKTTINGIEWKYAIRSRKARLVERELEDEMAGEIVIPSELDGFPVTSIGEHAFRICESLRGVKIPDSVTSIGDWVFDGCSSLRRVTIPESVTSIGYSAFEDCSSLKRVTIPKSVKRIGDHAFNGCGSLTSFIVDLDNPKYKSVNGMLLSKDGTRLIEGVNGNVVIPNGVTSIGDWTFEGRSSLKSVTIPKGVTSIGDWAFKGCSSLTSFTVAVDNPNYKSVNGMLLSKDGTRLISGVNGDVVIPEGVTSIDDWAFDDRSSLKSVTIPESVTSVGDSAFWGCSSLTSFTVAVDNSNYKSVNGMLLTKDGTRLIAGVNGNVVIPRGVTSIGEWAFCDCSSLTSVTIPEGVTSIGEMAFNGCSLLKRVMIPEGVTSIGENAFAWCCSLKRVTIPESVTSVGDSAFLGCSSLKSVTIPESVKRIRKWAFVCCDSLETVFVAPGDAERVKSLGGFPDGVRFIEKVS